MPGKKASDSEKGGNGEEEEVSCDTVLLEALQKLKKGDILPVNGLSIKEGETSPPKRYNSGSMILAMENAGQLIEECGLKGKTVGGAQVSEKHAGFIVEYRRSDLQGCAKPG